MDVSPTALAAGLLGSVVTLPFTAGLAALLGLPAAAVLAWVPLAVALGPAFALVAARFTNRVVASTFALTRRSPPLQRALHPVLTRSALAVTTTSMGVGYGLVVAVPVAVLAVPLVAALVGGGLAVPALDGRLVVVALVYGPLLGAGYGLALERWR